MTAVQGRKGQRTLTVYFVLAYFFTWLCWIPTILISIGQGWALPPPFPSLLGLNFASSEQVIVFLVFTMANYGPLTAAVVSSLLTGGKSALGQLWTGLKKWRVGSYWLIAAIFLPIILGAISSAPAILTGTAYSPSVPFQFFLMYLGYQIITSGFEEVGWRGYALPHLQASYTAEKSSWILGILWGAWHFPYVAYLSYGLNPFLAIDNMFGTLMSIIGLAFTYTWLYNNTRSILVMIAFHGWWNTLTVYIVSAFSSSISPILAPVLTWVVAIILVKRYGRENLSKNARPTM
jgi:membrane protease YdiL (CAAX protease family)